MNLKKSLLLLLTIVFTSSLTFSQDKLKVKETFVKHPDDSTINHGLYIKSWNGNEICRGKYDNNKRHGQWIFKLHDNNFIIRGEYDHNVKVGNWITYKDRNLRSEIYFSDDGKVDSMFGYNAYKTISLEFHKNQSYKFFHDNGNMIIQWGHNEGDDLDTAQVFFNNGKLHRTVLMQGRKPWTVINTYDIDGKEIDGGNLKDGIGTFRVYHLYEDFNTSDLNFYLESEVEYKNGLKDGTYKGYKIRKRKYHYLYETGYYKEGDLVGLWKEYNSRGRVKFKDNYDEDTETEPQQNPKKITKKEYDTYVQAPNLPFYLIGDNYREVPIFPGGEEKRISFLKANLSFPEKAIEECISGMVFTKFVISAEGRMYNYEIVYGDSVFQNEIFDMLDVFPDWQPLLVYGIPHSAYFTMPVKFTLVGWGNGPAIYNLPNKELEGYEERKSRRDYYL
jgi:antitoxin component YwqK of YwqJK toxin-antitoxin module